MHEAVSVMVISYFRGGGKIFQEVEIFSVVIKLSLFSGIERYFLRWKADIFPETSQR